MNYSYKNPYNMNHNRRKTHEMGVLPTIQILIQY